MFFSSLYNIIIGPLETLVELIFSFFYDAFLIPGYSILAVSVIVNLLVLPLYKRSDAMQEEEREKQKAMKPWLNHIKKTFKGDERFMMTQAYYREQHYKPLYVLKSSVSLLLQVPFFMAAYNYLSGLELLNGCDFGFLPNLGQPDQLIQIGSISINLLPILMTAINILSGMIYTKGFSLKEKLQLYGMALIFLVLLYDSPSGLVFYWTLNNIFSLVKNIFTKLLSDNNRKLVCGILSSVTGIGLYLVLYGFEVLTPERAFMFMTLLLVFQIPILSFFLDCSPKTKKSLTTWFAHLPEIKGSTFFLTALAASLLFGVLIPSSVVASSAIEFATADYTPYHFIWYPLCIYGGFFLLWCSVFYALGSKGFKKGFTYLLWGFICVGMINYFAFSSDFGTITTSLIFEAGTEISFETNQLILNWSILGVTFLAMVSLMAWKPEKVKLLVLVLVIGMGAFSIYNVYQIQVNLAENRYEEMRAIEEAEEKNNDDMASLEKKITLSKDGKNVIVFMIDRAVGCYVQDLMEERTSLYESFDGFTYYPNTLSFATHTNMAAPALFGGYDYTPDQINLRSDVTLAQKHDEAMRLLPELFASEDYTVNAYDLPFLGYSWTSDPKALDKLPGIHAENLEGKYTDYFMDDLFVAGTEDTMEWNFVVYSLFRTAPQALQGYVYHSGDYFSTKYAAFTDTDFLDSYSTLLALPYITDIVEGNQNTFLEIQNGTTHAATILSRQTYEPELVQTGAQANSWVAEAHYCVNMATFLKLGEWFDYLKENGVWDNTRIIVVSDHGYNTKEYPDLSLEAGESAEAYIPVLMVKDFNASGKLLVDNTFMTNADVPSLAIEGLVEAEKAVNPNTGNAIDMEPKLTRDMIVTLNHQYGLRDNLNGKQFDQANYYVVKDNVLDTANWTLHKMTLLGGK